MADFLILNFEGIDGATTWTEEAQSLVPETKSDAKISTAQYQAGSSSLLVNDAGANAFVDYIVPNIPDQNFEVIGYFYLNTETRGSDDFGIGLYGGSYVSFGIDVFVDHWTAFAYDYENNEIFTYTEASVVSAGEWHKFKITVSGRNITISLDDVLKVSENASISAPFQGVSGFIIGYTGAYKAWVDTVTITGGALGPTCSEEVDDGFDAAETASFCFPFGNSDGLGIVDAPASHLAVAGAVADSVMAWDDTIVGWPKSVSDSVAITDAATWVLALLLNDWLTALDAPSSSWNGQEVVPESLTLWDISDRYLSVLASISDSVDLADAPAWQLVLALLETLYSTDAAAAIMAGSSTAADSLWIADAPTMIATPAHTVEESLAIADTASFVLTVLVLDALGFSELVSLLLSLSATVNESLGTADDTQTAYCLAVQEILSVLDTQSLLYTFAGALADSFGLADTAAGAKMIADTVSESVTLAETVASQGRLYTAVYETLMLDVIVELGGEVYECYVLNTPKFYPSMYSGFNFNSYAVFDNKAFGANSVGIYELTGTTDAGSTIHSGVVFSPTDFGTPNQKRFRRGYFSISGTTPLMILEAENGERQCYTIDSQGKAVASHDLKGKKWTLSVADFKDLDNMKLIPVVLSK